MRFHSDTEPGRLIRNSPFIFSKWLHSNVVEEKSLCGYAGTMNTKRAPAAGASVGKIRRGQMTDFKQHDDQAILSKRQRMASANPSRAVSTTKLLLLGTSIGAFRLAERVSIQYGLTR